MDETIRKAERGAANGDPEAVSKLKIIYRRLAFGGDVPSCVKLDTLYRQAEEWEEMNALRAHCLQTDDAWVPTKSEREYADAELETTPLFAALCKAVNRKGVPKLLNSTLLPIAREALREIWTATLHSRQAELQHVDGEWTVVFPVVCDRCKARVNERCTTESGNYRSYPHHARTNCDFHPPQQNRQRFSHANYAQCIGFGEDPESELVKTLGERYGGGFLVHKTEMRKANKNGWYELRILPGYPGNEVCESFRVELHQTPDDGRKLPVIMFPPQSGDRHNLIVTEDIHEVASMSKMMRESELCGAQTPAVYFSLVDVVRQLEEGPD